MRSASKLGERGHEFGTVTGRKRRCGWFDAVLVRQAVAVSGITGVALTKLDVLDGFETVKICTGYTLDGEKLDYLPPHAADQARVEPVFEEIEGLGGLDPRRPQLGRPAGPGDQICPPDRGADPLSGRTGLDQPGARRHHPRPRPVRAAKLPEPRSGRRRREGCRVLFDLQRPSNLRVRLISGATLDNLESNRFVVPR